MYWWKQIFCSITACKVLATELELRLTETGKTSEVLEIGYSIVGSKTRTAYKKSLVDIGIWWIRQLIRQIAYYVLNSSLLLCRELRLLESLENVCDKILEYNIHKERSDSTRFAKGMSQTFKTLHGLVYVSFFDLLLANINDNYQQNVLISSIILFTETKA